MQGAEREYFYFPQNYDFLHLSVGDWRSTEFLRDLIERLKPEVVHFHHYHRVGVESIRAARLAAPDAVICLTFHEMMAICMADGQMVKKGIARSMPCGLADRLQQMFSGSASRIRHACARRG